MSRGLSTLMDVIASVTFQNFKVLRDTHLALRAFNLVVGPNGSGKTSLIQALLRLRTLSQMATGEGSTLKTDAKDQLISFQFSEPYAGITARLSCVTDIQCDALSLSPENPESWPQLKSQLGTIRGFLFDHLAMAAPSGKADGEELSPNGANVASVLAVMQTKHPDAFEELESELMRLMPEFTKISFVEPTAATISLSLRLSDDSGEVTSENLSQGTLYLLGMLSLAYSPKPPQVVCIEEIDRGIHPRMLREVRDMLYRLSYPEEASRAPVQVIATTHSPFMLDLFREHPEEVVISQKEGNAAHFQCLADRGDLADIISEGSLGDIWFSGILGGVPEEL